MWWNFHLRNHEQFMQFFDKKNLISFFLIFSLCAFEWFSLWIPFHKTLHILHTPVLKHLQLKNKLGKIKDKLHFLSPYFAQLTKSIPFFIFKHFVSPIPNFSKKKTLKWIFDLTRGTFLMKWHKTKGFLFSRSFFYFINLLVKLKQIKSVFANT